MNQIPSDSISDKGYANDIVRSTAADLRERRKGIRKSIAPLLAKRNIDLENLIDHEERWRLLREALNQYDNLIFGSLAGRYDALDMAVSAGHIPFVEIDCDGSIRYANNAFVRLVDDAVGQNFAELFGTRKKSIEEALSAERNSLRAELHGRDEIRQFRVEIGPLQDEYGATGAYAFLLNVDAEEARWEASLDGVLRLDSFGCITFTNTAAARIINVDRQRLLGMPALGLFIDRSNSTLDPVPQWLRAKTGMVQEVLSTTSSTPLRTSALPFFDDSDRQSGVVLTFHSIVEELAQEKLRLLLAADIPPLELIRSIIQTVATVVPNDVATFGIYTPDEKHFRTILVEPVQDFKWSTRWFDVTSEALTWVRNGDTWDNDMKALVEQLTPDGTNDPVVLSMLNLKLRNLVALPITGTTGSFKAALTLLSKNNIYGKAELDQLRALDLERILQTAMTAWERERDEAVRMLKSDLSSASSAKQVSKKLVEGVSRCFGWEYVGVFRIDRARHEFVLFAQHDSTGDSLKLDEDYRQSLDSGMFGHVLRQEKTLIVADTRRDKPAYDFIATTDAQGSAMATLLNVNGRPELLLALLAIETNAFQGNDMQELEELAAGCEQIIEIRWQDALTRALLDSSEQAAVVVDGGGTVRKLNSQAEHMLDLAAGSKLSDYGADREAQALLGSSLTGVQHRIALRVHRKIIIPTLGTQRLLGDDYGHRLWLFTDLRDQDWQVEWHYLDATVSEVAQQTRTPLLIAGGLLRQAASLIRSPKFADKCADLLVHAASQLGKADLTFERLSDTFTARSNPTDPAQSIDALAVMHACLQLLPADDRSDIIVDDDVESFHVSGWAERLDFAFRSLIGHLLLGRKDGSKITIHTKVLDPAFLRLLFSADLRLPTISKIGAGDPISAAKLRAHQAVQFAPEAVQAVIQQHKGALEFRRKSSAMVEIEIRLPSASTSGGA